MGLVWNLFRKKANCLFSRKRNNLLVDGDMEATGVTAWTVGNNATLTKETSDYSGSTKCLRVTYNATSNPRAGQVVMTAGQRYRVTGVARGDGTRAVRIYDSAVALWAGSASASWQAIDVTFTAGSTTIWLYVPATGAGYGEFDAMRLVKA